MSDMELKEKICPECGRDLWHNNINNATGCDNLNCDYAPELAEATRPKNSSGSTRFTGCATDFNKGTWYQSAVSGMWYQEAGATGDVAQIRLDGTYYIPFKSLKDKGL